MSMLKPNEEVFDVARQSRLKPVGYNSLLIMSSKTYTTNLFSIDSQIKAIITKY